MIIGADLVFADLACVADQTTGRLRHWYSSPVDYLAHMRRLAMAKRRRRIINDALAAVP
jgi:hypothetical protein